MCIYNSKVEIIILIFVTNLHHLSFTNSYRNEFWRISKSFVPVSPAEAIVIGLTGENATELIQEPSLVAFNTGTKREDIRNVKIKFYEMHNSQRRKKNYQWHFDGCQRNGRFHRNRPRQRPLVPGWMEISLTVFGWATKFKSFFLFFSLKNIIN